MRRILISTLLVLCFASSLMAANKTEKRLRNAADVLSQILDIPDDIPQELLDKAECVIVIPSVKKLAMGFGGSYGRGAMVCRSGANYTGPWGPPVMMRRLEGGSFGLQLGGQATDFVLLIMNPNGAESILSSKVKLGADASAAAGPKGRTASAATDAWMTAEILSYSRAKGLFAGVSLEGSTLRPDNDANEDLYNRKIEAKDIVRGNEVKVPPAGAGLVERLQKASPHNFSS
ncbi:MAG: lipid-binding SYLF domain-containing protein [Acidobacteriia bacterium]|nr:lipid-binding SYLF domain-containing protein [Terriglobia bacterium]